MKIAAFAFLLSFAAWPIHAEPSLLDQGYRSMYNLQFEEAHRVFREWEAAHPSDPMGPVSEAAAYLYAEFDRLHVLESEFFTQDDRFLSRQRSLVPDPAAKRDFEAALARTARLIDAGGGQQPGNDENRDLANVLRIGLHSDYLALIEKRNMAALTELKASRAAGETLLARHPECYDAYLAAGVENYMLSLKAAPIRWLIRLTGAQTDKQAGIARLKVTAQKGRYLKPYAKLLLAVAALRDKDVATAKNILQWLRNEFPNNRLYREELGKLK